MINHKKFITLLAVSTLTIAALPVVPIANLATVVVSAEGTTPTTSVTVGTDGVITINAEGTEYGDDSSKNAIDSGMYNTLLSNLTGENAKKKLKITGTLVNIQKILVNIGSNAFTNNDAGAKTLLGALNAVENLELDVTGDAVLTPEAIAYISFLKREALANAGEGAASALKTLAIDVSGKVTFGEKTVNNDDIPATIAVAIEGLGLSDEGQSATIEADGGITLPADQTDIATFFGSTAVVAGNTVTTDGGNGSVFDVSEEGVLTESAVSVNSDTVIINANLTSSYTDTDGDGKTYYLSTADYNALNTALATNKKVAIKGSKANIQNVLGDFATLTTDTTYGTGFVTLLGTVTDLGVDFVGDATIDTAFLTAVGTIVAKITSNIFDNLAVSSTGNLTLTDGVKNVLNTNALGAKVAFSVGDGKQLILPNDADINEFFKNSYSSTAVSVKEDTPIKVGDAIYVAGSDGSVTNPKITSLSIDADAYAYAYAATDKTALNALDAKIIGQFIALAESASLTVSGSIDAVRTYLTVAATAFGNEGAASQIGGAANIKTLNLAIDGDTEFIPNDLAYINYLKGQITSSSLDTLNIDVTGNVTFGAKLEGSDSSIPDTIAGSVSDTIFTTFSASGTVTLPEGTAATQKAIKAFFGKAVVADGTEVKVDGKTFISDGENGYEPKPSTPSTPGGDGGSTTPPSTEDPEVPTDLPTFGGATAHIQNIGDVPSSAITLGGNSVFVGTTGRSLRLEEVSFSLADGLKGLSYQVHVQDKGWLSTVADGAKTGTRGQGKRIEAIKFTLSKELDKEYDVYYRVHVQNQGTTKWYKTGDIAGTTGKSLRIEAIQVALVKKPANLPTEFK